MSSLKRFGLARRLLAFAWPYWPLMLLALVLILIMSGLVNYLPILIKRMTDDCLIVHVSEAARIDRNSGVAPAGWASHLLYGESPGNAIPQFDADPLWSTLQACWPHSRSCRP